MGERKKIVVVSFSLARSGPPCEYPFMTTKQSPAAHIASLIAELTARAANATGAEKARLESAIRYYQGARPPR